MAGKNKVFYHTQGRMSGLRAVRSITRPYVCFEVFKENFIFSPLSTYSPTPKAS